MIENEIYEDQNALAEIVGVLVTDLGQVNFITFIQAVIIEN